MTSERVVTDAERVVTDAERRARIGRRHALATEARCEGPEQVAAAMTVLHATDPATIHLSIAARSRARIADIDRALHEDRTLLRLMAMRQTLFVASLDTAPTVIGAAGARTAHQIRTPLIKELDRDGPLGPGRGTEWLARAADAVVDRLAGGDELSAKELADEVPQVAGSVERNPGTRWGGRFPLAPRVLALLHAQGRIVRTRAGGAAAHRRGVRRARPALAVDVRPRHRRGHPVVARRDEDRGAPCPVRHRGCRGQSRGRHAGLAAS